MNVMHGYILISDSMLIANLFTSDKLHGNDHTPTTHTVACCKLNHNILQPIIIMLCVTVLWWNTALHVILKLQMYYHSWNH